MFPLRDDIPSSTTPYITYILMVMCGLMFFAQLRETPEQPTLVETLGMIPKRVLQPQAEIVVPVLFEVRQPNGEVQIVTEKRPAAPSAVDPWLTLLTCTFLHGGWLHFLGNMWFLYIFGDNVEDRMGHLKFLVFYLASGVAASAAHLAFNAASDAPTIGASGAIAGVMGAYMLLYPKARVLTIVPIFIFLQLIVIPAPVFLGIWFLIQLFQGAGSVGGVESTGVAWWAHIGGFCAGAVVVIAMRGLHSLRPPVVERIERPTAPWMNRIISRPPQPR